MAAFLVPRTAELLPSTTRALVARLWEVQAVEGDARGARLEILGLPEFPGIPGIPEIPFFYVG
jgi:hypothetical protein